MENSPRSSLATLSTTDSRITLPDQQPSRSTPQHAKSPSASANFPSHLSLPDQSASEGFPHDRKQSVPYVEIERREREQESAEQREADEQQKKHHGHVNGVTECGRHGDDWLFGGASVSESVKWLLGKK
ncbi:uncharacterized protein LY89DRAFT_679205 [Mollisia scopiformis]|uniref:Uncharacterized protein n=1 Tax=Mollisia scopiformis TaxID=149040 RepID=A0A194XUW9_MOLSC|nr:uncharacterized protein LY89DRAFT_679205 [Mollisia scopiformis]KUJ23931.1 hypothetical protein LY89DRAFT_679205 [Mollisia scopiformis]